MYIDRKKNVKSKQPELPVCVFLFLQASRRYGDAFPRVSGRSHSVDVSPESQSEKLQRGEKWSVNVRLPFCSAHVWLTRFTKCLKVAQALR